MRKKFLFAVLGLMTAVGLNAQVKVDRGNDNGQRSTQRKSSQLAIKYGVKAGVNLSSMSNGMDFDPGFGMGIGYRAGVMANFHFGQRSINSLPGTGLFGVQPELMYSYQSVKSDEGDIKMSYIQLPIMLKVYPTSALSIEVGPEFNYLISTSPDTMVFDDATISVGNCKGFNIGAGAGLAYELRMGLVVGARYSLGFTDMAKNLKWKNNGNIQVTVGWLF
ncbi:MAG: PorT family protein [Muribaculaceae bacterium]|nr:PorT family protein [Muribaculaceae bacterium]